MTRGVILRGVLLTCAVALGGLAVWLILTNTSRRVEIGLLAGLWAALLGAFAVLGPRRFAHPLDAAEQPAPSAALELRTMRAELERAAQAAARREHEAQLEQMLRREIRAAVTGEIAALRAEIAELRSELLEKVGGQLRLERVETTRVIGSNLQALQHEVRQLKAAAVQESDFGLSPARTAEAAVRQIVEPARVRPVTRQTVEVEAGVQPATSEAPAPAPAPAAAAAPGPAPQSAPLERTGPIVAAAQPAQDEPRASTAPRPQPTPAPEPVMLPADGGPRRTADDFADLPRLSPFTDLDLDDSDGPAYTGRRRRTDEATADADAEGEETGRRHRRADDSNDDLLARLLAREGR